MSELGPYTLRSLLGRGGMGEVWEAVHRPSGESVAVKVVTARAGRSPRIRTAFEREARAVAKLQHPGVVRLFDYGVVPVEAELAVPAGSPYLVMERAAGSLENHDWNSWEAIRGMLQQILAALAHSHARDVVHCDLKPANILVSRDGVLRLADFGIARPVLATQDRVSGSPGFMAPEQCRGDSREVGPPTDFYALGCLAWEALTGSPPFPENTVRAMLNAHCSKPLPPLHPRLAAPADVWGWLQWMMAKSPGARPRSAAQAAAALNGLGPPQPGVPMAADAVSSLATTYAVSMFLDAEPGEGEPPASMGPAPRVALPFPADWRAHADHTATRIEGVGLGLFGLREHPLVGRAAERDQLWEALRATVHTNTSRVVRIMGPSGVGKTRTARWLAERATELGVSDALQVNLSRGPEALVELVDTATRCSGLARPHAALRLQRCVAPHLVDDLLDLLRPLEHRGAPQPALVPTVAAWLMSLAAEHPLVLVLDDVDNPEASALPQLLQGSTAALLCLVTSSSGTASVDGSTSIELAPLTGSETRALVTRLLGLRGSLASDVAARSGGVPLFAVALVGDWVSRGLLVADEGGFRLAPGADAAIPDAIHDVWSSQLHGLVRPQEQLWLERAAVLGRQVLESEWRASLPDDVELEPMLVRMADHGLLRRDEGRFTFRMGLLVDSIRRLAHDHGRMPGHRAACADALLRIGREHTQQGRGRRALATLERARSLQDDPACGPAIDVAIAGAMVRQGDLEGLMQAAGRAEIEARRLGQIGELADALCLQAGALRQQGRRELSEDKARAGLEHARQLDDPAREARCRIALGMLLRDRGQHAQAVEALERAVALQRQQGDPSALAECLIHYGYTITTLGPNEAFVRCVEEALGLFEQVGDAYGAAIARFNLGMAFLNHGQASRALPLLDQTAAWAKRHSAAMLEASACLNRGACFGRLDRWTEALGAFEVAQATFRRLGATRAEANAQSWRAEALVTTGDRVAALGASGEALALFRQIGPSQALAMQTLRHARIHAAVGDIQSAWADAQESSRQFRALGIERDLILPGVLQVELLCRMGEGASALAEAQQVVQLARQWQHERPKALVALARLVGQAERSALLTEALALATTRTDRQLVAQARAKSED
jgi:eukaryotic-like serine/threonine-protein kinase